MKIATTVGYWSSGPPGDAAQLRPHAFVKARRMLGIEAQLDGACDLVYILPARSAGADKALLDLALGDGYALGRRDHAARLGVSAPSAFDADDRLEGGDLA